MLLFDDEVEVVRLDVSETNDEYDAFGVPHIHLRPDGVVCRAPSAETKVRYILRVTRNGGLYLCNGDRVVESMDLRGVVHAVPYVVARLVQFSDLKYSHNTNVFHRRLETKVAEEVNRTAIAIVWPEIQSQQLTADESLKGRVLIAVFPTRRIALKFFEVVNDVAVRLGRGLSAPPDPLQVMDEAGDAPLTETSTGLRDIFEAEDAEFDDMKELEHKAKLGIDTTNHESDLDLLKRESGMIAQGMIERLTAAQVNILSPFPLINARPENSMVFSDDEPTKLEKQNRSKNPVPVLEAFVARRPEYFDEPAMMDFFHWCRELYAAEKKNANHTTLQSLSRCLVGIGFHKYFTGAGLERLFHNWAIQRRREEYSLNAYVLDLQQYLWYLQDCESRNAENASSRAQLPETLQYNPLDALSGSIADRLELCIFIHKKIEEIFERRRANGLEPSGGHFFDPHTSRHYAGRRSRSNVFPDLVVDQLQIPQGNT